MLSGWRQVLWRRQRRGAWRWGCEHGVPCDRRVLASLVVTRLPVAGAVLDLVSGFEQDALG